MFEKKVRSIVIVCVLALMMLAGIVSFPSASALTWVQDDDIDFSQGSFTNTEIVGTGPGAYVALKRGIEGWADLYTPNEPSAREGSVMAYDSTRDVFVMFGGYNVSYLDDTWEYDYATNSWTQIITPGPPGREWGSMVYDSVNDVFVLFGGFNPGNLRDTWEYIPATQTWIETTPAFSPQIMYSYALAFDSSAGRCILEAQDFASSVMQTWAYDASLDSWVMRAPLDQPPKRIAHTITYNPSIGKTVLFGGIDGFTYLSDVWEYDYSADEWLETTPASGPSGRYGHAAAYRTWDDSVVIYGGTQDGGGYPTDTWKYWYIGGLPRWTQISTILNPGPRRYLVLNYDPSDNATVAFGGSTGLGWVNDTWELASYYTSMGWFISSAYDSQYTDAIWQRIYWNLTPAAQPPNTQLDFQLAYCNLTIDCTDFVGPDGTVSTYYSTPGEAIRAGTVGRFLRYRARLISWDGMDTPHMDDVTVVYTIPTLDPRVALTSPGHMEFGVLLDRNIYVLFSEPMNTATVTWTIDPDLGGWTEEWDSAEAMLYLNHSVPLQEAAVHTVEITGGQDKAGNAIIPGPVPNPWIFVTVSVPPVIDETEPAHNDIDVPLDYPIWINFSEPMDTATVVWTIGPDPGGWTENWQNDNQTLYLTHSTDYTQCVPYVVEVTAGKDRAGIDLVIGPVANPWTFQTVCFDPFVQSTDPIDQEFDVPTNYPIIVTFSKEVDSTTLSWAIDPDPGGWTLGWGPQNRTLTLDHSNPFASCTLYTVEILDIQDLAGGHLIQGPVANPWRFMTTCPNPFMLLTTPPDLEQDVPTSETITILFSETMATGTLEWTIHPDPGSWTEVWFAFDMGVELQHTNLFGQCTYYTVEVTAAEDLSGNPLIPGFVPNPWMFNTSCFSPVITETSPVNASTGVQLDEPIWINFSRPMDTTTLTWGIVPDPGGWSIAWQNSNMTVVLTHSIDYLESQTYVVTVSYIEDEDGNLLVGGPVPNPFRFTTVSENPYVLLTDPADGAHDVALDQIINITFSEPMATGTVTWGISPDPGGWTEQWLPGDTVLSLSHSNPFSECLAYTLTVTYGEDLFGNPLVPGPVPNPFTFFPICTSPIIIETCPVNNTADYPVDKSLWVNFSEPMDTATVGWIVEPFVGHQSAWSNQNRTLRLDHIDDYTECDTYKVTISGDDMDGNPLVGGPVPNPFYFTAVCANPQISSTDPYDGEMNVSLTAPIVITFSEEMDNTTVTWTISPDPGGWTESWESMNTVLNLTHSNPFAGLTPYTVEVLTGNDTSGLPLIPGPAPNPWTFTTLSPNPYIVSTIPVNGSSGVSLDASIIINFNEEIDVGTFQWTISPDPGGWSEDWTPGNMRVTLSHTNNFAAITLHMVTVIAADDMDGYSLIPGPVPNPWVFTTGSGMGPQITDTNPFDGASNVPLDSSIWINFSTEIDTATFVWSIDPVIPGATWTPSWSNGNMTVRLSHDLPYAENTLYMVTVVTANDTVGNPLTAGPVPNPWSFTTGVVPPYIMDTYPPDGARDVPLDAPIIVNFSEPMDPATLIWSIAPDPGGWSITWSPDGMNLRLDHMTPYDVCTRYTVTITVNDLQGLALVAGPVPNPWSFDTICTLDPPPGLAVSRILPSTVRLDWNSVPYADSYNVYESGNRFAPFPSGWTVVNTANTFFEFLHLDDGLTHYYIVRAYHTISMTESTNSTMGVKIDKAFTTGARASIYWMSLPYNNEYASASDIATELGETNVNIIAKWDRATQRVISYYYARGRWRGRDFALGPGDGFYLGVVTNFNWYIVGTDSSITIDLPYNPQPFKHNKHYISVPYTGSYSHASDIVVDIEGGLGPGTNSYIIEVGLWDAASQRERTYTYTPTGWAGDNFAISPGDGIYLRMVATYGWQPQLLTPEVP